MARLWEVRWRVVCAIVRAWVWAVVRVIVSLVVVVGRLSEGVVGARGDDAMEPLAIRVACLHIGNVGAVEREVEAVLALG